MVAIEYDGYQKRVPVWFGPAKPGSENRACPSRCGVPNVTVVVAPWAAGDPGEPEATAAGLVGVSRASSRKASIIL